MLHTIPQYHFEHLHDWHPFYGIARIVFFCLFFTGNDDEVLYETSPKVEFNIKIYFAQFAEHNSK